MLGTDGTPTIGGVGGGKRLGSAQVAGGRLPGLADWPCVSSMVVALR